MSDQPKILVVDDEAYLLNVIQDYLQEFPCEVTTTSSGKEALKVLKNNQNVEVVILDVKMPDMDGIETLGAIKKRYPLVEVIMLSGHSTVETAIEGMKLGAFDYLMKPCDMDQIIAKVSKAAAEKREHEEKIIQARVKEITSRRA